jgi:hypothetical protein
MKSKSKVLIVLAVIYAIFIICVAVPAFMVGFVWSLIGLGWSQADKAHLKLLNTLYPSKKTE